MAATLLSPAERLEHPCTLDKPPDRARFALPWKAEHLHCCASSSPDGVLGAGPKTKLQPNGPGEDDVMRRPRGYGLSLAGPKPNWRSGEEVLGFKSKLQGAISNMETTRRPSGMRWRAASR